MKREIHTRYYQYKRKSDFDNLSINLLDSLLASFWTAVNDDNFINLLNNDRLNLEIELDWSFIQNFYLSILATTY